MYNFETLVRSNSKMVEQNGLEKWVPRCRFSKIYYSEENQNFSTMPS